jgi:PKD repeat protein
MAPTLNSAVTGGTQPYTFAWNLGDGSSSTASSVNHSYAAAGTYTANLTVTDSRGVVAQSSVQLTVYPALSVSASAAPSSGDAPLGVAFAASAAGGLAPYTFTWTFGDGATATGQTVNHSFAAGTFHPTLTVHDAAGGAWTGTVATITPAAPAQAISSSSSSGSSSAGTSAGTSATPPAAGASTPSPEQPSPSAQPSASAPSSPSGQAAAAPDNGSGSGGGNTATLLVVLGSIAASGLGGSVFLWWRRQRIV